MSADEAGWSAPPKPEDLVAPWDGRDPNPAAAQALGRPLLSTKAAAIQEAVNDLHHRGRRIFCRSFTLLPILVLGVIGLIGFGNMAFSGNSLRSSSYPPFAVLCVVLPLAVYGLFSRHAPLRFTAIATSSFAALAVNIFLILALIDRLAQGYRTPGAEIAVVGVVWSLSLACTCYSAWLIRLELDRLRGYQSATTGPWQQKSDTDRSAPPTTAGEPAHTSSPAITRALLARRQRWLYRLVGVLPITAFPALLAYRQLDFWFRQGHPIAAYTLLALVLPLVAVLAIAPWRPARWWRVLALGANVAVGIAGGTGLCSYLLRERILHDRYMTGYYNYYNYSLMPTTFGLNDPDLTIFTFFMLALMLACLTCAVVAFRLLRHELAEFRQTAPPLPAVAVPPPKADDDLTPAGGWDQAGKT